MKKEPTLADIEWGKQKWLKTTIADDFLFSKLITYQNVCERLLSMILGEEVELVLVPRSQDTIGIEHDSRGIRLDAFAKSSNTYYIIEMQATDEKNLFERERLYRGITDTRESFKGMEFIQLKKSVIIFICTFDPQGRGQPAYIQESYESNYVNHKSEGDVYHVPNGAKTIYLNAKAFAKETNPQLRNFLAYVMGHKVEGDEFIDMLDQIVTEIKLNPVLQEDYIRLVLRDRAKIEQGKLEKELEMKTRLQEQEKRLKAQAKEQEKLLKAQAKEQEKLLKAQAKEQEKQLKAQAQAQAKEQEKLLKAQAKAQSKEQEKQLKAQAQAEAKEQEKLLKAQAKAQAKEQEKLLKAQAKAEKEQIIRNLLTTLPPEQVAEFVNVDLKLVEDILSKMEK